MNNRLITKRHTQLCDRLAANVRRLREKADWSQQELSRRSGIHRTHVSLIERKLLNPTLLALVKVALALRVNVQTLLQPTTPTAARGRGRPRRRSRKRDA